MATEIGKELAGLQRTTPAQLREKHAAVFGEAIAFEARVCANKRSAFEN